MYALYHQWLCPFSRKIRILLAEKKLPFELIEERPWEQRNGFLALNPASETPVLVLENGGVLADSVAISEYLEETHPEYPLLGEDPAARAEVRRLVGWFDSKFHNEVGKTLVGEKIVKRLKGKNQSPDSRLLRDGYESVRLHIYYVDWLAERRNWMGGPRFSLADIAAAAHISCVDYLGDVPWEEVPAARDWYSKVKSRPSIRPVLTDHLPGMPPAKHYANLDF